MTDAQRKAVARLKNRDTLSTIAALGDDEDDDEDEGKSVDEVEHVESDFIQAKAAKKRPVSGMSEATADKEARDDRVAENTVSKKPRRAAAEKQMAAQSSIFCDDAIEERCGTSHCVLLT